ncbi:hypothetical protein PISMIDRAFT_687736 [Pisolithus microcarpus 441]|uniref:Uncharacterized protein n=1 Tax=Pisolithus microcarpus 441 TaxID=765257 RepID=A0A0C9YX32_9AGAM|nr:hypothetical protein BKA83DRAFT_687736 [Pisolithus microcarpus]KIK14757.1 hypothetical protein PISMIDRAFT_687736 [Pisolithus microcarpus 441]
MAAVYLPSTLLDKLTQLVEIAVPITFLLCVGAVTGQTAKDSGKRYSRCRRV